MKIGIIQPRTSYYVGGSEKISLIHAKLLSERGHNVTLHTISHPAGEKSILYQSYLNEPKFNIFEHIVPKKFEDLYTVSPDEDENRWKTESFFFNTLIFNKLYEENNDIVYSYYLPDALHKPFQSKNIVYLCGYPINTINMYRSFFNQVDGVISISNIVEQKWREQIKNVPNKYMLGTGVTYPVKITNIPHKYKYNIVFAGRLIERKGVLTLLEAFNLISSQDHSVHLWILGDGPQKNEIIKHIHKLKLEKQITLCGMVSNLTDYFGFADISVFPSYEKDGLMGVVLEAMSVGSPVVTTIGSGSEDVIESGVNGFLVKPKDVKALFRIFIMLIYDENKKKLVGELAKKEVAEKLNWNVRIKSLENIFQDIIKTNT